MRYGLKDGLTTLVGAADTLSEFEVLGQILKADEGIQWSRPGVMEMMTEEAYKGLKLAPYVITHVSEDEQEAFLTSFEVTILKPNAFKDRHRIMLEQEMKDEEEQTIEEMFNLDEHDPWDTRTPEEKARDAANAEAGKAAKAAGDMTGESFAPPKRKSRKEREDDLQIRRMKVREEDGEIRLNDVMAIKGAWFHHREDEAEVAQEQAEREANKASPNSTAGRSLEDILNGVAPQAPAVVDPTETFFQFDLTDEGPEILDQMLEDIGFMPSEFENKAQYEASYSFIVPAELSNEEGGWFRLRHEVVAARVAASLDARGIVYSANIVDGSGNVVEQFVPNEQVVQAISPKGMIAKFHRVDLAGAHLHEVSPVLVEAKMQQYASARCDTPQGCWFAAVSQGHAESMVKAIIDKLSHVTVEEAYPVNDLGMRLVPKGVQTVDTDGSQSVEPPRPWNFRAHEIGLMTEEERKANDESLSRDEFIFTGRYIDAQDGTVVWITPRSYFKRTGEMWPEPLDIAHLLPGDLKPITGKPGAYRSYSRNWETMSFALAQSGFGESMYLQLWLNSL